MTLTIHEAPSLVQSQPTIPQGFKPVPTPANPLRDPRNGLALILTMPGFPANETPGRIRTVTGGQANWYVEGMHCTASLLNPEPDNGKHYFVLNVGVVQYFDHRHQNSRHYHVNPYNMIATTAGVEWPIRNDSLNNLEGNHWIEVERVDPAVGEQAEVTVDRQVPEANRFYRVEITSGTHSVCYFNGDAFISQDSGNEYKPEDVVGCVSATTYHPDPIHDSEKLAELNRLLHTQQSEWERFNEVLNELADDHDFCSEYEGIIEPLGLSPRNRDYSLEINVTFEATIESPSGMLDERISSDIDLSVTTSEVRFTAEAKVWVERSGRDSDDAYGSVDSEDLEDRLRDQLSGCSNIDVTDWSLEDSTTAD